MTVTKKWLAPIALAMTLSALPIDAQAQSSVPSSTAAVPTIKVLAVGRVMAGPGSGDIQKIMPREVRATVDLYLKGKIDQWYVKQDGTGVVFIMNVTTPEEARELLEALPLGQAKLMTFDLTALGPLNPLRRLIQP